MRNRVSVGLAVGQSALFLLAVLSAAAVIWLSSAPLSSPNVLLTEGRVKATPASWPGGVSWTEGKGYSYVAPESLKGPKDMKGQLAKISKALSASLDVLDKISDKTDQDVTAMQKTNSEFGSEMYADKKFDGPLAPGEPNGPLGSGWEGVSDEDYKTDVQRGVLKHHSGFPEMPQCPTEGLWGSYRKGYVPGQPGGNCQDASLLSTGWQAAHLLKKKHRFNVGSWNQMWREDLDALKRQHSYYKLTKGLWSNVAPDAEMAYYMPNNYHGSLEREFERPAGESTTENAAHANSIVPVQGHPNEYYSSDFAAGSAEPATPVQRVFGSQAGTTETNDMRPMTAGLDSRERRVISSLHQLNQAQRQRLHMAQGIVSAAKAATSSLSLQPAPARAHTHFQTLHTAAAPQSQTLAAASSGAGAGAEEREIAGWVVPGQAGGGDDDVDAAALAQRSLHQFRQLRRKFKSWARYFKSDKSDFKPSVNNLPPVGDHRDAYFWCYAHYSDYSPNTIQGSAPSFEECLRDLGGYDFGEDEKEAFGPQAKKDDDEDIFGVKKGKAANGFGEGIANTLPPVAWKYFEATD